MTTIIERLQANNAEYDEYLLELTCDNFQTNIFGAIQDAVTADINRDLDKFHGAVLRVLGVVHKTVKNYRFDEDQEVYDATALEIFRNGMKEEYKKFTCPTDREDQDLYPVKASECYWI